jgi:hypothetical protein
VQKVQILQLRLSRRISRATEVNQALSNFTSRFWNSGIGQYHTWGPPSSYSVGVSISLCILYLLYKIIFMIIIILCWQVSQLTRTQAKVYNHFYRNVLTLVELIQASKLLNCYAFFELQEITMQ